MPMGKQMLCSIVDNLQTSSSLPELILEEQSFPEALSPFTLLYSIGYMFQSQKVSGQHYLSRTEMALMSCL